MHGEGSVFAFSCGTFSAPDIAIDLGTAFLRACSTATAGILEMPASVDDGNGVKRHPLRGGAVVDVEAATRLLAIALGALRTWHARPPRVLATVPTDVSADEQDDLVEALVRAGAGMVAIVPEPVAAAVGVSLHTAADVRMLIDVGEGVTDIALLERGILLDRASIRLGCAQMREGVIAAVAHEGVTLTQTQADALLCDPASAAGTSTARSAIAAFVRDACRQLHRSAREDVRSHGVCITGGGALTCGVASAVAAHAGVRVFRPERPLQAVIRGSRTLLGGDARHVWGGFPSS